MSRPACRRLDCSGRPQSQARDSAWTAGMHRVFLHLVSNPRRPAWPCSQDGQRVLSSKRESPSTQVPLPRAVTCRPRFPEWRRGSSSLQVERVTGTLQREGGTIWEEFVTIYATAYCSYHHCIENEHLTKKVKISPNVK